MDCICSCSSLVWYESRVDTAAFLLGGARSRKGVGCCLNQKVDKEIKSSKFWQHTCVCYPVRKDFSSIFFLNWRGKHWKSTSARYLGGILSSNLSVVVITVSNDVGSWKETYTSKAHLDFRTSTVVRTTGCFGVKALHTWEKALLCSVNLSSICARNHCNNLLLLWLVMILRLRVPGLEHHVCFSKASCIFRSLLISKVLCH